MNTITVISIKDATEQDIRNHYNGRNGVAVEFDKQRPPFYMTNGQHTSDPLIQDYRRFLISLGIKTIAIYRG